MKVQQRELITLNSEGNCPHCEFIQNTFCTGSYDSKREYWLMTEVFVYLHDSKDYCDYGK